MRVQGGARNPSPRQRSNAALPRNSSHFKQVVRLALHRRQAIKLRQAQPFPTKQTTSLRPTAPAVNAAGVPYSQLSKTKFCADLESRGIASCGCRAEPAIPHRVSGQTRLCRATLPTLSKSSDLRSIAVRQSAPTGATVPHQANHRFAPINFSLSPRIFIPPSLPRLPRRRRPRIFRDPPDLCTPRSDRPAAKRTVCRA